MLRNVNMTLLRRILREPVFCGHPVISKGPEGVHLIQVWPED